MPASTELPRYVRPYRADTATGPVVVVAHTYAEGMAALLGLGFTVETMRGIPWSRWTNILATNHMRHISLKA